MGERRAAGFAAGEKLTKDMTFLEKMRTHFAAEKSESLLFILIGLATLTTAGFCWLVWRQPFYRGMAWPLAAISLIELMVGATVYFRTDRDMAFFEEKYGASPASFAKNALAKMKVVMRNFTLYRWAEIGFMVVGLALILWHPKADFWKGWGAGMFLQGGLLLLADFFAEKRGHEYVAALREIEGGLP